MNILFVTEGMTHMLAIPTRGAPEDTRTIIDDYRYRFFMVGFTCVMVLGLLALAIFSPVARNERIYVVVFCCYCVVLMWWFTWRMPTRSYRNYLRAGFIVEVTDRSVLDLVAAHKKALKLCTRALPAEQKWGLIDQEDAHLFKLLAVLGPLAANKRLHGALRGHVNAERVRLRRLTPP